MPDLHKVRKVSIFDPLSGAGGGKRGPRGPAGATGADGADGPPGAGINWTGAWSSGTTYAIGDGVSHSGSSYIATAAGTNHIPPNASFWDVIADKGDTGATGSTGSTGSPGSTGFPGADGLDITWRGAWSGATTYAVNDAVSLNGSSYICILGHTNHTPPNGTYWDVLAAVGSAGSTGSAGADGARNPFGAAFSGAGLAITLTGDTKVPTMPLVGSGTISKIAIMSEGGPGTVTFGLKKCARSAFPGSLTDVTGGADITMSAASAYELSSFGGWTTAWSDDDVYEIELKAVDGVLTWAGLMIYP